MLASKWFDPVLGVDIHIILVPTPAGPVPTPLPNPFVGMVFDPAGMVFAIGFGAATGGVSFTLVNGLPVTNTGTARRTSSRCRICRCRGLFEPAV